MVGNLLTSDSGTWNDNIDTDVSGSSVITYAYQWQKADDGADANLTDISGATANTYTVTSDDAHKYIRIKVTATDSGVGTPATQSVTEYSGYLSINNTAPVIAQGDSVSATVDEDGFPTTWSTPVINASDVDGDALTWSKHSDPSHGTATVSGSGSSPVITYTPTADFNGSDSFVAKVTDSEGATDTVTLNITVSPVNDAPVLTANSPSLTEITEDETDNIGDFISDILTTSVTDIDAGAVQGIAVYSTDSGNGTWEYSVDSGVTWNPMGAVDETNALLLRSDDKIRFVPDTLNSDAAVIRLLRMGQDIWSRGDKRECICQRQYNCPQRRRRYSISYSQPCK